MRRIDYAYNHSFRLKQPERYTDWIISVITEEGQERGRLMYTFCDDEALLKMNRDFLQHDYYTDILTFPISESKAVSGEIYISVDRVADNAEEYKVSMEEELRRVMIHGVLHLLGYEDHTDRDIEVMRKKEAYYMEMFHVKQ